MFKRLWREPARDASLWILAPWFAVSFVLAFAVRRGALFGLPILVAAAFIWSSNPWLLLGVGALLYVLILAAAALSGLVFAAIGPPLFRVPIVGSFVAFALSSLPYSAALAYAIAVARGSSWRSYPGPAFLLVTVFVSMAFGGVAAFGRHSEREAIE